MNENFSDVKKVVSAEQAELEAQVLALRTTRGSPNVLATNTAPFSVLPGFNEQIFDLSDARLIASGIQIQGNLYGIRLALSGTSPGAVLQVNFENGQTTLYPGTEIKGEFRNVTLKIESDPAVPLVYGGATVGQARVLFARRPDFSISEEPCVPSGPTETVTVGPGGAATQTYNVAVTATTNGPSSISDGIDLLGLTSLRALVTSSNGGITAGRIRWWVQIDSNWFISTVSEDLNVEVTGNVRACTSDNFAPVGGTRAYAELVLATNVGGSGAFTVELQGARS